MTRRDCNRPGCEQYVEHSALCLIELKEIFENQEKYRIHDAAYWLHLGTLWRCSTFYDFKNSELWCTLLTSPRPGREYFAHHSCDRDEWAKLPDPVTIYRGYIPGFSEQDGIHWTKDRHIAMFFATEYVMRGVDGKEHSSKWHHGTVLEMTVPKSDCLFRGGGLDELLYLPNLKTKTAIEKEI